MRVTSFILIGLLSCVFVSAAEVTSSTEKPKIMTSSTSKDTTSVVTTENSTFASSTTEFRTLIQSTTKKTIQDILSTNVATLSESNNLLNAIKDDIAVISSSATDKMQDLNDLTSVNQQLANTQYILKENALSAEQALANTNYSIENKTGVSLYTIENFAKEQQEAKDQIMKLQNKLSDYQKNIVDTSKFIDNSIVLLNSLVSRAVLPKLNNLKSQLNSVNTAQVSINAELPNISVINTLNKESIGKLNDLDQQLSYLKLNKDTQLKEVTDSLKNLDPKNLTAIANSLQDLSVQQKRIDLGLTVYDKFRSCSSTTNSPRSETSTKKYKSKYVSKVYSTSTTEKASTKKSDTTTEVYSKPRAPINYSKSAKQNYQSLNWNPNEDYDEIYEVQQPETKTYASYKEPKPKNLHGLTYSIPATKPLEPTNYSKSSKQTYQSPKWNTKHGLQREVYETEQPRTESYLSYKELKVQSPQEVAYSVPETKQYYDSDKVHDLIKSLENQPNVIMREEASLENTKYINEEVQSEDMSLSYNNDYYNYQNGVKHNFQANENYDFNKNQKSFKYYGYSSAYAETPISSSSNWPVDY